MKTFNFEVVKDFDTRDNSDLFLIVFERLEKNDFDLISRKLKEIKINYSKFKKGFISREFVNREMILEALKEIDFLNVAEVKPTAEKLEYKKLLSDYISINDIENKVKEYFSYKDNRYYDNDDISYYIKRLTKAYGKDTYFSKLDYIREAIIHKSLGHNWDTLYTNGGTPIYFIIWDFLPTIDGLKLTETWFFSSWGYDQTNIDVAWLLNKKLFSLDVLVEEKKGRYLLKRIKDDMFHDNNIRYFIKGKGNPQAQRERDASYTGQYH